MICSAGALRTVSVGEVVDRAEGGDVAGSATCSGSGASASSGAVVGSGGVDVGREDGGEGGLEAGDGC
jgi:hypothetical protein